MSEWVSGWVSEWAWGGVGGGRAFMTALMSVSDSQKVGAHVVVMAMVAVSVSAAGNSRLVTSR